jgi:hypothetical protein
VDLTNLNIGTCDNPTFVPGQPNTNYLATIAPLPPACDMTGAGPCAAGVTPNGIGSTPTSSGTYPGNSSRTTVAKNGAPTPGAATGLSPGATSPGSATTAPTSPSASPSTQSGQANSQSVLFSDSGKPAYVSATLPAYRDWSVWAKWASLAVVLLLVVFALPALIGYRRSRKGLGIEQ